MAHRWASIEPIAAHGSPKYGPFEHVYRVAPGSHALEEISTLCVSNLLTMLLKIIEWHADTHYLFAAAQFWKHCYSGVSFGTRYWTRCLFTFRFTLSWENTLLYISSLIAMLLSIHVNGFFFWNFGLGQDHFQDKRICYFVISFSCCQMHGLYFPHCWWSALFVIGVEDCLSCRSAASVWQDTQILTTVNWRLCPSPATLNTTTFNS